MSTIASSTEKVRRPLLSRQLRRDLRAYLFLSPWLIGLLAFTAYPTLASFYFSLTKYNILTPPRWVGTDNYVKLFTNDPLFWTTAWNTAYYTLISVPLGLAVALGLALLLNQRRGGIGIYRTAFYLPSLVPAVVITLVWSVMLDPRLGLINTALRAIGLPGPGWLRSAAWAKPALIMMALWSGSGAAMLIFLAGLKDIPASLLDAAMIDGANRWQRFRHVVLPLLTPTIFFNLIIGDHQLVPGLYDRVHRDIGVGCGWVREPAVPGHSTRCLCTWCCSTVTPFATSIWAMPRRWRWCCSSCWCCLSNT